MPVWGLSSPPSTGQGSRQKRRWELVLRFWGTTCSFGNLRFFSLRPSEDWVKPTHIREGNLLSLKSLIISANLIYTYLHGSLWIRA